MQEQELSYRKQIARQLRTQDIQGINSNPMTLKSTLRVTQGHWKRNHSSSSRMRVIYHNWSATKQRPHPQSVAEISRHSVLSGDRIRQCETSSGSRHKDTDQCLAFK